ncbi:hypothetical protein ACFLU6_13965, partial [Acidobacteriota bacterium]
MKVLAAIIILTVIAFIGARASFNRFRFPLSATHMILSGTEFLIVGMILGDQLLGILDHESLGTLTPFLSFALGWAGFLFGSQFSLRRLRALPQGYLNIALVQSFVAFLCILIPVFLAISF